MAYVSAGAVVSRVAWGVARQLSGVESQHPALFVPFQPLDFGDGRRAAATAVEELEATWLMHGRRASVEFVDVLQMLAAPRQQAYGWVGLHNRVEVGIVAATDGELAVRVAMSENKVTLDSIDPRKLIDSVVEFLPRCPPSGMRSITVPREAYERVMRGRPAGADSYLVKVQQKTTLEQDAAALKALLAERRRGGGRLYAASREQLGRQRESAKPLTFLDLEHGRVIFRERANSGGETWLVAAPANAASLATDLANLFRYL